MLSTFLGAAASVGAFEVVHLREFDPRLREDTRARGRRITIMGRRRAENVRKLRESERQTFYVTIPSRTLVCSWAGLWLIRLRVAKARDLVDAYRVVYNDRKLHPAQSDWLRSAIRAECQSRATGEHFEKIAQSRAQRITP